MKRNKHADETNNKPRFGVIPCEDINICDFVCVLFFFFVLCHRFAAKGRTSAIIQFTFYYLFIVIPFRIPHVILWIFLLLFVTWPLPTSANYRIRCEPVLNHFAHDFWFRFCLALPHSLSLLLSLNCAKIHRLSSYRLRVHMELQIVLARIASISRVITVAPRWSATPIKSNQKMRPAQIPLRKILAD